MSTFPSKAGPCLPAFSLMRFFLAFTSTTGWDLPQREWRPIVAPRGVPSTNDSGLIFADFQDCTGNVRDPENIALATAIHASLITRLVVPDRGVKRARFVVLRNNAIPGVLIEGGFLTNPRDALRVASPAYRELLADAVVRGVIAYNRAVARGSRRPPASISLNRLQSADRKLTPEA